MVLKTSLSVVVRASTKCSPPTRKYFLSAAEFAFQDAVRLQQFMQYLRCLEMSLDVMEDDVRLVKKSVTVSGLCDI